MTQIKITDLSVTINEQPVLQNLNLSFTTDERILIWGESGCGKSTLLLSLIGLTQQADNARVTGEILIGDRPVQQMKATAIAQKFGLVFQNPESQFCSLYPQDEVAFGLENLCVAPAQMKVIIDQALAATNFPREKSQNAINTLSGGEQQRLALAAVWAQQAEMFLLDEPTANLDPRGRKQLVAAAKTAAATCKGLLVVEHNLEDWLPFLNRIIILARDGTIRADGDPRAIFKKPETIFAHHGPGLPRSVRLYAKLQQLGANLTTVPLNAAEFQTANISEGLLTKAIQQFSRVPSPSGSAATMVSIKDLTVAYTKGRPVLHQLNLDITAGDFWALVGGNGSGKTTLAKTLLKLVTPSGGAITLDGRPLAKIKLKELSGLVGYVFQNPEHQFIADTVWAELAYSVNQLELDSQRKQQYVRELLAEFGLQDYRSNNPFSLSWGQKRRLSVATMLTGAQKLLILDEPTFGQDAQNAAQLMDKLVGLNQCGLTILMITHDLDLVAEYAPKTAVLQQGRLVFSGATAALWRQKKLLASSGLELPFQLKVLLKDEPNNAETESI
jgi:energy-coupling factor transporter ATP-binding protein EcfA2